MSPPIHKWPEPERPREKLLRHGPERLSSAELLALFLHTGRKGKSAVALGQELLETFGGLAGVFSASLAQMSAVPGVGRHKFALLKAVHEVAHRTLGEILVTGPALNSSESVKDYLRLALGKRDHEAFFALFLDGSNRVIAIEELSRGTLTETSVYPREVVKAALVANAAGAIFAHNHPSGEATPTVEDEALTAALKAALAMIEVRTMDHLIVAGNTVFSFADHGLL